MALKGTYVRVDIISHLLVVSHGAVAGTKGEQVYHAQGHNTSETGLPTRPRCNRCFAEKDVSSVFQGASIACCRACRYKIAEVMDFLSYYGIGIVLPDDREHVPDDVAEPGAEDADSNEIDDLIAKKGRRAQRKTG